MKEGWDFTHLGYDREATHGGIVPHPVERAKGRRRMLYIDLEES
jgi:hypothetical protein